MSIRKFALVLLATALFVSPMHAAAKRRISGMAPGGPTPPTAGDCATYKPVRVGLKASYLTTSPSGNATYTVTYVADSSAQTITTQKVTAVGVTTDVETRLDFDTVPNASFDLRALRHLNVKSTSTPIPGFNIVTETDIDFVPSYVLGPANGWCKGNTWIIPATTETITVRTAVGTQVQTQTTVQGSGEVLAVGESVTTPAGTFSCIKQRTSLASANGVSPAIAWNAIDGGFTVKQDALDADGNTTSTTTLQSLQ